LGFQLRTGWVVVRRKVWRAPSSTSTVIVLGDMDGDDSVGVRAAEGEFLAGDHDDGAVGGVALHGDRSVRGRGGGPNRPDVKHQVRPACQPSVELDKTTGR
jgi:hypothetical protein